MSGFFTNLFNGVKSIFSPVTNVVNSIGQLIGKIPNVINNFVSTVGGVANHGITTVGNTFNKGIGTVQSLGSGLELTIAIPLILLGVGVFFLLRNSNPNTISEVSRNVSQGVASASQAAPLFL